MFPVQMGVGTDVKARPVFSILSIIFVLSSEGRNSYVREKSLHSGG